MVAAFCHLLPAPCPAARRRQIRALNVLCKPEAELEAEAEREADGNIDSKGKDEAAKILPMRRLREIDEMGKGDCSIEVAERQKRRKETDADPDDKEMEVVSEDEELSDFDEEEAKRWYEKYLVFKRNQEQERVQECLRDPDRLQDRHAYEAKLFRKNWDPKYGSFDKKSELAC